MPFATADRAAVDAAIAQLPAILSGRAADPTGTMPAMLRHLGREALACFHEAFLVKSAGGTDAAGIRWPDLKRTTKAYSRQPESARKRRGERPRGLLTEAQDKRWRQVYAKTYHWLRGKGLSDREAAGNAAAHAWHVLKLEGAKTKLAVFGAQQLPILQKTGTLADSLDPDGHPQQVLNVNPATASVTGGSALPYAAAHHHGSQARGLPARPFWPESGKLPQVWEDRLTAVLEQWAPILLGRLLAQGALRRAA